MDDRIWIRIEHEGQILEGYLFPRGGLLYGGIVLPQSFRIVLNGKYLGDLDFDKGDWSGIDSGLRDNLIAYIAAWYE